MITTTLPDLSIDTLLSAYRSALFTPRQLFTLLFQHIDAAPEHHVWITRLTLEQVMEYVDALEGHYMDELPLYGIPFVIKDNIDLAGIPTTAGCAEFAYVPDKSATVVNKLIQAGAIPLGKTNLDQFATGLNGTRSPYGAVKNSVDPAYISGGSSSGSAVALGLKFASFALGTDTAGSGRVPAAFNNLIGLKPSCGRLSNKGLIPACRSLDCISIFVFNSDDAGQVLRVAQGFDADDAYSRPLECSPTAGTMLQAGCRIGVPRADQLQFFGDAEYERLFAQARERLGKLGLMLIEVDFSPLFEAALLLYDGPWVAERYAAIESFMLTRPEAMHPVTRRITEGALERSAVDVFKAQYRLQSLRRQAELVLEQADVFMTPTAGTVYTIEQMLSDPICLNSNLGYYTNFMNLLDLAAIAVPAGARDDGLPFGVTFFAVRDSDEALLQLASHLHPVLCDSFKQVRPPREWRLQDYEPIAVCGAHMKGLPLNYQLANRGAYLLRRTATTPSYRLYSLTGGRIRRPGLVRVKEQGVSIEVEVWAMHRSQWGAFINDIPAPLGLGQVELTNGESVTGFLCEPAGLDDALDISGFGGWRAYVNRSR